MKIFRKTIIRTDGSQDTILYVHFIENYCENATQTNGNLRLVSA